MVYLVATESLREILRCVQVPNLISEMCPKYSSTLKSVQELPFPIIAFELRRTCPAPVEKYEPS